MNPFVVAAIRAFHRATEVTQRDTPRPVEKPPVIKQTLWQRIRGWWRRDSSRK